MRAHQEELEHFLLAAPATDWGEAVAKARYLLILFAQTPAAEDLRRARLIADVFADCLAGQVKRIATVTTMTESVIARLEKAAIVRVIHQEPAFTELFIRPSSWPDNPRRSRPRRSAVQFE